MSIATIHHTTDRTTESRHEIQNVHARLDHSARLDDSASLRRQFTRGQYVPRHRAEGPAI